MIIIKIIKIVIIIIMIIITIVIIIIIIIIIIMQRRLSITIQRFNAVCFAYSFGNFEVGLRRNQPRHNQFVFCFIHNF